MSLKSLSLLAELIKGSLTRESRRLELLKHPSNNSVHEWAMFLPPAFNDALDIKQTPRIENDVKVTRWTQGSMFDFSVGDTIYDTPIAYGKWENALHHLKICIQITESISASPGDNNEGRFPGSVSFTILKPNKERDRIVAIGEYKLSQDDFVKLLIIGPDEMALNMAKKT